MSKRGNSEPEAREPAVESTHTTQHVSHNQASARAPTCLGARQSGPCLYYLSKIVTAPHPAQGTARPTHNSHIHITSVISRHPAAGIRNGVERDTARRPVECVAGLHTWKELGHCRVHAPHACAALPRLTLSYFPPQVSLTLSTDSHTGAAAKSSRRGKSASCSALRTGGARMYAVGS